MSCDAPTLMTQAKCFDCIPPGMQEGVQTYLLASIAGGSMDPATLIQEAKCFTSCLPPSLLESIKTHLLCEIVESISPTPPVAECIDSDAQAFVTAAGITDETQIYAVCRLVTDLKTYPAVGTKYWDRDIVIYPLVGGTALAHSINLKNPGGANNLTYGAGAGHSALGLIGTGAANSYANTNYTDAAPLTLNSVRAFMYVISDVTVNGNAYFGAQSTGLKWFRIRRNTGGTGPITADIHNATSTTFDGTGVSRTGAWIMQRRAPNGATEMELAYQGNALATRAAASADIPNIPFYLLAVNVAGAASLNGNCTLGGWSIGTPLNNSEWLEYRSIWEAFQTRLGRQRP